MEQQETTTENKQENTSRSRQAERRSLSGEPQHAYEPQNTYEPHYVVITGTNIRSTLPGKDFTPKVYDSEAIAFAAIDAANEHQKYRKRIGITVITPRSPISVTEYDRKYSAYKTPSKE